MNLLAQNISLHAIKTGGESSAEPPSSPIQTSTEIGPVASETQPEAGQRPQQEFMAQAGDAPTTKAAGPGNPQETPPRLRIPPILLEGDEPAPPFQEESKPKFALGVPPVAPSIEAGRTDLPEAYGTERLWLAARDPHCLYARWDVLPLTEGNYRAKAFHGQLLLRIHLEKLQNQAVAELELRPNHRHCFIPVAFAGRSYLAELGYYQENQSWHSITLSNPVSTPHKDISKDKTIQFATVHRRGVLASPTLPVPFDKPESPQEGPTREQLQYPGPLSLPEIFTFANTLRIPQRLQQGQLGLRASPEISQVDAEGLLEIQIAAVPDWSQAQEEALAELIDWSAAGWAAPSSAEFPSALGQLGAVSSFPLQTQLSSPAGGQVDQQENFWFSVNTELVVYGATEPTARVSIGGRAIQLRPDGTFSYRFALPDGRYELAIEAVSEQGGVRRAHLEFYRGTSYQGEVQAHPQDPQLKKPDAGNLPQG